MCTIDPVRLLSVTQFGRRRIQEIPPGYHCMICGSCLSVHELRVLAAKAGMRLPRDATDFEIHGRVVHSVAQSPALARVMERKLDRKFHHSVKKSAAFNTEAELREWWKASLDAGDIVGPYWALMTHPAVGAQFSADLFGEMHMLSHLEGSTNRAYRNQMAAAERRTASLTRKLMAAQERLTERQKTVDELRALLREARPVADRLAVVTEKLKRFEAGTEYRSLVSRIAALEHLVGERETQISKAEERLSETVAELSTSRREIAALRQSPAEANSQYDASRTLLADSEYGAEEEDVGCDLSSCPFDLAGRRIVYIGGRMRLMSHLRNFVESANGEFIHHDGGVEDNSHRLGHVLSQGDAVFCPMDCVSHGACIRARRYCKQTSRVFVPLRSSGLSSFLDGLHQLAMQ